ncbi:tachylectin-related carbohydrate-binding protein [Actinokineospora diospyrosa]|uniref:Tachylectin n=1 Tax=Actinokineospora diospyrosa TaxID=103728 RepID=A0ABT1IGH3_9PSEU|nr:tachylectin-related carbohydrate-binding protein [Actinokineospora diospyrosa]MCP2271668.1 Tachylectin [Actinokineospora diospyrosa]
MRTVKGVTAVVVAVTAVLGLPTMAVTAAAAPVPTCASTAEVYGVEPDGRLFVYRHTAPSTGAANWSTKTYIGSGWADGYTLASGNGNFFHIDYATDTLRRYHWSGTGWDAVDGARQYQVIGHGFAMYTPNLIVDSSGNFFGIDAYGRMRYYAWDANTESWAPGTEGGMYIGTGWGPTLNLVSGDNGIVYRRTWDNELYRYRYDSNTGTWPETDSVGAGWWFDTSVSSGGGALYTVGSGGNLYWYHYDVGNTTWANSGLPQWIGQGWGDLQQVLIDPSTCTG